MASPLMPKATAVWLIDNTTLSFDQIANFCELHPIEVQSIADGDVSSSIRGVDPIKAGIIDKNNLAIAEQNNKLPLKFTDTYKEYLATHKKQKARYTPIARRQDKPDAIAWLVKRFPSMKDKDIIKLIGTTKNTIDAIRTNSHKLQNSIQPRDPVLLGLCSQIALESATKLLPKTS